MLCCRIVNVIKNKNIKKQPWNKVECFAFGGATVRFASLETSFHAANHTIPPPPSYEGYPLCPKDKNLSPFHGEQQPAIYTENQQVAVFFNKVHNIVDHNLVNPTNTA